MEYIFFFIRVKCYLLSKTEACCFTLSRLQLSPSRVSNKDLILDNMSNIMGFLVVFLFLLLNV